MYPANETLDDFPEQPPVQLALPRNASNETLLGNLTTKIVGFRLRRTILSVTGRDISIADSTGTYRYATDGQYFTFNSLTELFAAQTGRRIAMIAKLQFAMHRIYDVGSYDPVCPSQEPWPEQGPQNSTLYPFARLTKSALSLYDHWTLERFSCNGSLTPLWQISSRHAVSLRHHYDVTEVSDDAPAWPIGTIDQSYYFQFTPHYDAWLAAGRDEGLFVAVGVLIDLDHLYVAESRRQSQQNGGGQQQQQVAAR